MSFDREDTLKKAEKLLRQGRLDAAITEYLRVIENEPHDWSTANTLGDLYVRAGQPDQAAFQYGQVAEHFMLEGFYSKASALYKKLLKLNPDDEASHLHLGEVSQKQGHLADAKSHFSAIAARRRARGDRAGAAEMVVRLGAVDPADFESRLAAARMLVEMGDERGAADWFRRIHDDLLERDREQDALAALREAVRLDPDDQAGRATLARAAVAAGDLEGARTFLDRDTAGDEPGLLAALLEIELTSGNLDEARAVATDLAGAGPEHLQHVIEHGWSIADTSPEAAYVLISVAADAEGAAPGGGSALLQEFARRVPGHIPVLLRLIEVCVDAGLEAAMNDAQAQLADAYLASGQAAEARAVAEDLVAREPWVSAHVDRFRRALVMLKVPEPDVIIADRLSGQVPFTALDRFVEAMEATPAEESPAENERDLTGALGQLHAPEEAPERPSSDGSLDAAFHDFRQDLARQNGADQSAQQMALARTYLEMGMPDDAIAALKSASQSPRLRFEAASLLGRLHRDRGEMAASAEWLAYAAGAPAPGVNEGWLLRYDLGAVLEESGDTTRALAIFLELQSEAGEYRDVARRIERLTRVEAGG